MSELLKHPSITWLFNWINWIDTLARITMLVGIFWVYESIKNGGVVVKFETPQQAVENMYLEQLNDNQEKGRKR